jgi:RNA polymerase sigma factor (sigma-70 family)
LRTLDRPCSSPAELRSSCSSFDDLFTQIWQQHRVEMLSLCRRCTRQEADAEEALSRASLLLYRKLPGYLERVDNLRGWILRLTFNVCMSLHRENRRRSEQSLEEIETENLTSSSLLPPSPSGDPESTYLQKELGHYLRSSIENLPDRLRETMIGHLTLDGYREVADRLAINEANARKRMQEAREALSRGLVRYRAGGDARSPSPRPPARARKPAGASQPADPAERVRALRTAIVTLRGGEEREGLLALHLPLSNERRDALERYVGKHPRGGTKRLALARALLEEGRAEEALPHLEAGVERQPRRLT